MPNTTTSTAAATDPILYDMSTDYYVPFSQIADMAKLVHFQNMKVAETRDFVEREPRDSAFAAHWTRKARGEMDDEYAVNYVALKEAQQAGLISSANAIAWGVLTYYERVEAMHARLGMSGPICVTDAQKARMEKLVRRNV